MLLLRNLQINLKVMKTAEEWYEVISSATTDFSKSISRKQMVKIINDIQRETLQVIADAAKIDHDFNYTIDRDDVLSIIKELK